MILTQPSPACLSAATVLVACLCVAIAPCPAASFLPQTEMEQVSESGAIFVGAAIGQRCIERAGNIHTLTLLSIDHAIKGNFGATVIVTHRGGAADDRLEHSSQAPVFCPGTRYLVFATVNADGDLCACHGSASVRSFPGDSGFEALIMARRLQTLRRPTDTPEIDARGFAHRAPAPDSAPASFDDPYMEREFTREFGVISASGLTEFAIPSGNPTLPARFLAQDSGDAIGYLVDDAALPVGVTLAGALAAIDTALAAWSSVTSLRFRYDGIQRFGRAASDLKIDDGRIRIQLHDSYNAISSSITLGLGGMRANNDGYPLGGAGARVDGVEYHRIASGHVIINHRGGDYTQDEDFAEVLAHELGHALGLTHSSEAPAETNAARRNALMYFQTHGDRRGAVPTSWDIANIQKSYPPDDTPPSMTGNVHLDATTFKTGSSLANPGVNDSILVARDLQTPSAALGVSVVARTGNNGTFRLSGTTIRFIPAAAFRDSTRLDPAGNRFLDEATIRFTDGDNASPYVNVRVISFNLDTTPGGALDGIPDWWVKRFSGNIRFGNAHDDPDNDGCDNLCEYLQRTDPGDASSNVSVVFSQAARSVDGGDCMHEIVIRASRPLERAIAIPFTLSGTGVAGIDYQLEAGSVSPAHIAQGQTSTRIRMKVMGNPIDASDKTVVLTLSQPTAAAIGDTDSFTLTITNNNKTVTFRRVEMASDRRSLRVRWSGYPGGRYLFEYSPDLLSWRAVTQAIVARGIEEEESAVELGVGDRRGYIRLRQIAP